MDLKRYLCVSILSSCAMLLPGCGRKYADAPPLSPQESLKAMHFSEDFHAELFLSEPQVESPVEMAWDENGKLYVAEMLDYPEDPPPGTPARSRIRLLEDTDGDGKYDKVTVFADHVLEVSGLMPWKGGLLVTSAPDIYFMKDTDGDGKADVRQVLFHGFSLVDPEGRITNLRLRLDNWIYAANSGSNGSITQPDHPERPPVLVRGADFRFRPDRGLAEPASGPTQFGMALDDWGDRFISQNTVHIRNVVVPMQYLIRAPLLEVSAVSQDISDHGRPDVRIFPLTHPQKWRQERTRIRQQRYNENKLNRIEQVGGYFTAATGGTAYTGDAWPQEYRNTIFTGDVSANLVHRDILKPDGVTFLAHRAKDGVEFLASTDVWFRPCNFANAPDGNLYMTDIYREFIETPASIPEEIKKNMDFYAGANMGRIWRIASNHPLRQGNLRPQLGKASTAELVQLLASTNGWHQTTAQRLLVDRQDHSAVPLLEEMAAKNANPVARARALWTLEGLDALEPALVLQLLKDSEPRVREQAIRVAEEVAPKSRPVADQLRAMIKDADTRVQFQLAFSLGQLRDASRLEPLAQLALAHQNDHWFRTAVLSSVADSAEPFFQILLGHKFSDGAFLTELASMIGAKHDPAELARFFPARSRLPEDLWAASLTGLAKGLKLGTARGLKVPSAEPALESSLNSTSPAVQTAAWEASRYFDLPRLIRKVSADALAANLPLDRRVLAVRALRGAPYATSAPLIQKLLETHPPSELQAAAVDALSSYDDAAVGPALLNDWKTFAPEARKQAVDALLNHKERVPLLIKALQSGQIEAAVLDLAERARLISNPDPAISAEARKLLQSDTSERAKVVAAYQDVVKLTGHEDHGKLVFHENCAKCHMPRKLGGGRVGPDLSGVNNKTKEELLNSILNPSASIEPRFTNYMVTTQDGRMYDGVIASETPGSITLRSGEGGDETILRKNIADVRASSISLMPEGLERSLSKQDLADVIAYLRAGL